MDREASTFLRGWFLWWEDSRGEQVRRYETSLDRGGAGGDWAGLKAPQGLQIEATTAEPSPVPRPPYTAAASSCAGKAGNPFQTTQGNRLSCGDQEGRRGSDEAVPGPSVFPSRCPTLSDPMDCSLPGSSIHGIFHARVLEWGTIAFSHQKSPDTPGSPEGNTEGPGTASSEPLLPS